MEISKITPHSTVLVLNSSYEPLNFTNWKRAVVLLLKNKAQVLSQRVIRLLNYVKLPLSKMVETKPSKAMIYKRYLIHHQKYHLFVEYIDLHLPFLQRKHLVLIMHEDLMLSLKKWKMKINIFHK